jgi:hypothetical protein
VVYRKLFCHVRENFPKERAKARNGFSNENKNHQQNPFSEAGVSSSAAVSSVDAVWHQILTGASCDRLKNSAWQSKAALYNCNRIIATPKGCEQIAQEVGPCGSITRCKPRL